MQLQPAAKDFAVVDGDVEVLKMQGLLPRTVKINDLQLHLLLRHHVQMLVLRYYRLKMVMLFESFGEHLDG